MFAIVSERKWIQRDCAWKVTHVHISNVRYIIQIGHTVTYNCGKHSLCFPCCTFVIHKNVKFGIRSVCVLIRLTDWTLFNQYSFQANVVIVVILSGNWFFLHSFLKTKTSLIPEKKQFKKGSVIAKQGYTDEATLHIWMFFSPVEF